MLLNGVLRTKLLNIPFASCSFINLDFSQSHAAHFDDSIVLTFFDFNTFGSTFSVSFLNFKQYDNMFYNYLCLIDKKFRVNLVPTSFLLDFCLDYCFKNLDFSDTQ